MTPLTDNSIPRAAPLAALVLGTLIVLASFYPILAPLGDPRMVFVRGDFTTIGGNNSAQVRMEHTFSTFSDGSGRKDTNRFVLLGGFSALAAAMGLTDTQFNSALILASTLLGCLGIFLIMKRFVEDWRYCAAMILVLTPFYFLNLWSVERIGHIWIWFTYAVFPLFAATGLAYMDGRRNSRLIVYSLLFAFYGALPHSFIYLGMIHALLIAYAVFSGWKMVQLAKFAAVPMAIYVILTMPFLLVLTASEAKYPQEVTKFSFTYLSKNGDMANLLAMTNNWWPSLDEERIRSSWVTRYASFGFFVLVFAALASAFPRLRRGHKAVSLLSASLMMACMFVAQGNQNQIMKWASDVAVDAGLGLLLAPFREWARVCLLIPLLLAILFAICIPRMRWRRAAVCALAVLVAFNLAMSPSWEYLEKIHGAVAMGDEFSLLAQMLDEDSKTLYSAIRGSGVWANSTDGTAMKVRLPIPNAGDGYMFAPIIMTIQNTGAPQGLLDALNIRRIVMKDGSQAEIWYGEMECGEVGYLRMCNDTKGPQPFRAYRGTVLAGDDDLMSLAFAMPGDFAVSDELAGRPVYAIHGASANISGAGIPEIFILEGEDAFTGKKRRVGRIGASGNSYAAFNGTLRATIIAGSGGTYRIAVIGSGPVNVSVDGRAAAAADSLSGFEYGHPFQLGAGRHNITASGGPDSALDVIWAYPDPGNATIGTLFREGGEPPARILSFSRDGPTRWHVRVNATEPFLLSFSEAYMPGWEARVSENGLPAGKYYPVKLFGAINGYWIDRTGDLDIELRYAPQDLFDTGLYASAAGLLACAAYLSYSLWRGD